MCGLARFNTLTVGGSGHWKARKIYPKDDVLVQELLVAPSKTSL